MIIYSVIGGSWPKKDKRINDLVIQTEKAKNIFTDLEAELKGLVEQNNGKDKEIGDMKTNIADLLNKWSL